MITKISAFDQPLEIYGLSTDTKPLDVPNASRFIEMDTSKVYLFDEENTTWHEFS